MKPRRVTREVQREAGGRRGRARKAAMALSERASHNKRARRGVSEVWMLDTAPVPQKLCSKASRTSSRSQSPQLALDDGECTVLCTRTHADSQQVVCPYFLKGTCRYGNNCRNEHPREGQRQGGFGSASCYCLSDFCRLVVFIVILQIKHGPPPPLALRPPPTVPLPPASPSRSHLSLSSPSRQLLILSAPHHGYARHGSRQFQP